MKCPKCGSEMEWNPFDYHWFCKCGHDETVEDGTFPIWPPDVIDKSKQTHKREVERELKKVGIKAVGRGEKSSDTGADVMTCPKCGSEMEDVALGFDSRNNFVFGWRCLNGKCGHEEKVRP